MVINTGGMHGLLHLKRLREDEHDRQPGRIASVCDCLRRASFEGSGINVGETRSPFLILYGFQCFGCCGGSLFPPVNVGESRRLSLILRVLLYHPHVLQAGRQVGRQADALKVLPKVDTVGCANSPVPFL